MPEGAVSGSTGWGRGVSQVSGAVRGIAGSEARTIVYKRGGLLGGRGQGELKKTEERMLTLLLVAGLVGCVGGIAALGSCVSVIPCS